MASEVGILNAALTKIGSKQSVTSFTQGSPAANFGAARYADLRDDLLRDHNWNFAIRRVKLARLAAAPTFGYSYAYELPDKWLKILNGWDNEACVGHLDYLVEDNKLLCNSEEVWIKYITQVTDPNAMPADFRECLALKLAVEAAITIAGSSSLSALMEDRFSRKVLKATSNDAFDTRPSRLPVGSWHASRFRGL